METSPTPQTMPTMRAAFLFPRALLRALPYLMILFVAPASAEELVYSGVTLPRTLSLAGQQLNLNGYGARRMLGFRVYVAALYLPQRTRSATQALAPDSPRRLALTLLRDTTTEQNLEALKEGMADNNPSSELDAIEDEIDRFMMLISSVHEVPSGSRITLDYIPDQGTLLRFDNRLLGVVAGERFNRALMKIWLGDDPIQVSLKKSLLGQI